MPAKSKAQQRLFGMVHAYQKGKLKHAPAKVREIARHVSSDDARHFAETSHKGLPERKREDEEEKAASFAGLGALGMSMTPYERGFFTKCAEAGLTSGQAMNLIKYAAPGDFAATVGGDWQRTQARNRAGNSAWWANYQRQQQQQAAARDLAMSQYYANAYRGAFPGYGRQPAPMPSAVSPQPVRPPAPAVTGAGGAHQETGGGRPKRVSMGVWEQSHPELADLPWSERYRAYQRAGGRHDWGAWMDDIGSNYQTKSESLDQIMNRRDEIAAQHGVKINGDAGLPGTWLSRMRDRLTMSRPEFHRIYADKANKQLQQALAASGRATALNNRVGLGLPNASTAAPKSTPTPKTSPAPSKTPSTAPSVNLSF